MTTKAKTHRIYWSLLIKDSMSPDRQLSEICFFTTRGSKPLGNEGIPTKRAQAFYRAACPSSSKDGHYVYRANIVSEEYCLAWNASLSR